MARRLRKKRIKIEYEPISVRELLTNMKTYSDLMLDLAYSSMLFSDMELVEWVMELEEQVDRFGIQLLMTLSLAVRDKDDAEAAVGLFRVASSANRISDAAADIAALVHRGKPVDPIIRYVFNYVDEQLVRAKICPGSAIDGRTINDIWDQVDVNVDIIAVRCAAGWAVNPRPDFIVHVGDIVFVRGSDKETEKFVQIATGVAPPQGPPNGEEPCDGLARAILRLKETTEFMISLAYAVVTYQDAELAQEVAELEDKIDLACDQVLKEVMSLQDIDVNRKWALVGVVFAAEEMADAAWDMAQVQLSGLPTHEIITSVMSEAEDIVTRLVVAPESPLADKTLSELALDDTYGIYVQSIKRDGRWFHRPRGTMQLKGGDTLIVIGYRQGLEELREIIGVQPSECCTED